MISIISRGLFRRKYRSSLRACLDAANDAIYTSSNGMHRNRAAEFYRQADRAERLEECLASLGGILGYEYLGSGDNAVVLRYSNQQILRLRAPEIGDRPNTKTVPQAPMICPIWKESLFEGGRLNFVPYVTGLDSLISKKKYTEEQGRSLIYSLMQACFNHSPPIWFYDYKNFRYKFEQIGIFGGGVPIIIDLGAVIYVSDSTDLDRVELERDKLRTVSQPKCKLGAWDGVWHDSAGNPRIDALDKPSPRILDLPDSLA